MKNRSSLLLLFAYKNPPLMLKFIRVEGFLSQNNNSLHFRTNSNCPQIKLKFPYVNKHDGRTAKLPIFPLLT